MTKPYDTTTKVILEGAPDSMLEFVGHVPDGPIEVIDSDLATVAAQADKVYRINGPHPYVIHIEMVAGGGYLLPRRVWRYNAMLDLRHDLRVWSIVVLLRPEADAPNLTGVLDLRMPDRRPIVEFHYDVVRCWQRPIEPILEGPLATLPLAPLADVPVEDVPGIIQRIDARLLQEAPAGTAGTIMEAALVLAGLRLGEDVIGELRGRLGTVNITTESSYYRLAVREGREEGREEGLKEGLKEGLVLGKKAEARQVILRLGEIRFGPPDEAHKKAIEAVEDIERLEHLGVRLLAVSSWDELLAESTEPQQTCS